MLRSWEITDSTRGVPTDKPKMTNMYFDVWLPTPSKAQGETRKLGVHTAWVYTSSPHETRHVRYVQIAPPPRGGHTTTFHYTDYLNANLTFDFWPLITIFIHIIWIHSVFCHILINYCTQKYLNLVQRISFSTTGSKTNSEGPAIIQTILLQALQV